MATIGLYDIDFNHGNSFSISLPLMKAYRKLSQEGHIVVMMQPYENTGRYNKIFYFKEGQTKIPKSLTIDSSKGKMVGYGFYGSAGLLPGTALTEPDFTPYDLNSDRIKNKTIYSSIKNNSIIDWREKDFTGVHKGASITYVNDRDFMNEYDWEDIFDHFDNNICFIHTLHPTIEQLPLLIPKHYYKTRICVPISFDEKIIKELLDTSGIAFDNVGVSNEKLILFILFCKILSKEKLSFRAPSTNDPLLRRILKWGASGFEGSYEEFCRKEIGYMPMDSFHYNFKPRTALRQKPSTMSIEEFKSDYFKSLT